MAEYRDQNFAAIGAQVVALSVDEPVRAEAMRGKLKLTFPVLCDNERQVVRAWGLFNAEENGGIAYPAVFVIDRDLKVRYRSLDRTAARVSTQAVMDFIKGGMQGPTEQPKRRTIIPGLSTFAMTLKNVLRYGVRSPSK